ncbi:MAG: glycosyltransferase WbuB, partial [Alphaproteobacteria bacterium]|nr:glycosyltransferase WbuB [Alphaproteobacteria bacterium]
MESGDIHLVSMRKSALGLLVPCKFYSGLTVGRPTIFLGPQKSELGRVIRDYHAGAVVPLHDAKKLADMIYHFRSNSDAWFKAQDGALRAAQAYHPNLSLHKWVDTLEKIRVSG